jgi:CTP:molybdopterin cytidylyltransferase MocA
VTTAAVVLAAGGSSRFAAGNKLTAPFRGRPLVTWAVEQARAAGLDEVAVVVGAEELPLPDDVVAVPNPRWAEGQATSLATAVAWAGARGHDAVVVGLGDQPLVPASAWAAVAASDAPVAVARFGTDDRPPVRLHRSVWPLLPTTGDEGARALIRERPDLVQAVACQGEPADLDTEEDFRRWS